MKKLINLTVYDAKNMICVWNENEPEYNYQSGIALEDAVRGFMVPQYYVVGVFDDGSSKAAGIFSLSDINQNGEEDDLEQLFYLMNLLPMLTYWVQRLLPDGNLPTMGTK